MQAGSQINTKTRSNVETTFEEFEENIKDNNADTIEFYIPDKDENGNYTSYCIGNGKADLADNTKYGKILTRNLKKPTFFSEIEKQAIDYYMDADQGFSLNRDSLRYMYKKKNASITLLDN